MKSLGINSFFSVTCYYNEDMQYNYGNIVLYNGNLYKCISSSRILNILPTNTNYWEKIYIFE